MVQALEKEEIGKWVEKETYLPAAETPRGYNRCYNRNACMFNEICLSPLTHTPKRGASLPLTLVLATFPSVALRSASSCSDQLRFILTAYGKGSVSPVSSALALPAPNNRRTTQERPLRQIKRGNTTGRDAISDQSYASGNSQGRGVLGKLGGKAGYPHMHILGGSLRRRILVKTFPDAGYWRHHTDPRPATAAAAAFKTSSRPGKSDFGPAAEPFGKLSSRLAETTHDGGNRTTFPWRQYVHVHPTVKLVGKLSLSDSIMGVSKEQINYVSQDASRKVNCVPLRDPHVLGKWSPSCPEN